MKRKALLENIRNDQDVILGDTGKATSSSYKGLAERLSMLELDVQGLCERKCNCNITEWETSPLLNTDLATDSWTNPIVFTTELQKGHTIENISGWQFLAKKTGSYHIDLTYWADFTYADEPIENTVQMISAIYKNSVLDRNLGWDWNTTDEDNVNIWFYNLSGNRTIFLEAGQYIDIRLFYDGSAPVSAFTIATYASINISYEGDCVKQQENAITNNWSTR